MSSPVASAPQDVSDITREFPQLNIDQSSSTPNEIQNESQPPVVQPVGRGFILPDVSVRGSLHDGSILEHDYWCCTPYRALQGHFWPGSGLIFGLYEWRFCLDGDIWQKLDKSRHWILFGQMIHNCKWRPDLVASYNFELFELSESSGGIWQAFVKSRPCGYFRTKYSKRVKKI